MLNSKQFKIAKRISEVFDRNSLKCYLVGGCVRDYILGKESSDIDLVTTANPSEIHSIFPDAELVGSAFGVFLLKQDNYVFELACAREERNYMDGRHPEKIQYTRDLKVDVLRRDFTINGLMLDPLTGKIYDYVGGIDDLNKGIIRTIGNALERFNEDYLRMLRAVRFAARFNFSIEANTFQSIRSIAEKVLDLSAERIENELTLMLTQNNSHIAVEMLKNTKLLEYILPEVYAMIGVTQPVEYHPEGDVYVHTLLMLKHMVSTNASLAWSVLLHDVGKPLCRSVEDNGRIRFFCHEKVGSKIAAEIAERFRFSSKRTDEVTKAINNHMRFSSVKEMKRSTLRRLLTDDNFALELELHRLDCYSSHKIMDCWLFLLKQLGDEELTKPLPQRFINGKDLIAIGLKPSPKFKKILNSFYEKQLSGEISDRESALKLLNK